MKRAGGNFSIFVYTTGKHGDTGYRKKKFTQNYNPLYFLSSLGNGGLAVSFFMYLMFMVKHPDTPIPIFNHVYGVLKSGNMISALFVGAALLGIFFFIQTC